MIETDSPYLIPRDLKLKTRRNEPMHLKHIAEVIANLRKEPFDKILKNTTLTSQKFFNL